MSDSQNPTAINGASPDLLADFKADRSLDIACHLLSARAIADLVFILCGSEADGSGSHIDELAPTTLSDAMYCIMQNVDGAQYLRRQMDEREIQRKVAAAAKASAAH